MNPRVFLAVWWQRTFVLLMLASGTSASAADDASNLDWLQPYNQVWTSQSTQSKESMPVGGHDIGLNVWAENGDVLFYLQRSGSIAENSEYLKLGRVRLELSPNPFAGGTFRQELKLEQGYVQLDGETIHEGAPLEGSVRIWAETGRPVVRIEVSANQPVEVDAAYENWRLQDESLPSVGTRVLGTYTLREYPGDITLARDEVAHEDNTVVFYHRNPDSEQVFDRMLTQQGLQDYRDRIYNEFVNRTFGGMLTGDNLVAGGQSTGRYMNKDFRAWHLLSAVPANTHNLRVVTHIDQAETLMHWRDALQQRVQASADDLESAREDSQNWWGEFWGRSWITVNSDNPNPQDKAWSMARNYNLFRYQLGTNAFGEYPTKFNGGNFTTDAGGYEKYPNPEQGPDWRAWGGGLFTAQNQRLVYWPMLKSGDFDAIHSQFGMYKSALNGARARVAQHFDHDGALFSEWAGMSGLAGGSTYGWSSGGRRRGPQVPFGDSRINGTEGYGSLIEAGVQANSFVNYHYTSQLEFSYMILEYHRYTGHDISEYMPFIEESLIFFDEHYRKRQRLRNGNDYVDGKLHIYPSSSLEALRGATNPVDVVAGLKASLQSILRLDDSLLSMRSKAYYRQFLNRIPDFPWSSHGGRRVMQAAEAWQSGDTTHETPYFYPLFPFNNFDLLGDDQSDTQAFLDTFEHLAHGTDVITSWKQNGIFMARMGLADDAAAYHERKLANASQRYPTFWGPGHDWAPDHNWGGSGMIGLQEMVLQTTKDQIHLLPAWPTDRSVAFKLHAPGQMIVEADYTASGYRLLKVTKSAEDMVISTAETLELPFTVVDHSNGSQRRTVQSSLLASGDLTNNGVLILHGDVPIQVSGDFINNGVIDISNWDGTLPGKLIDNGIILRGNEAPVTIYDGVFSGSQWSPSAGDYPFSAVSASPVGNDRISSLIISDGYAVELCRDDLSSVCRTYTKSTAFLDVMDNEASSLKVMRGTSHGSVNVAHRGNASQSSTFSVWSANRAVDGDTSGLKDDSSVTHTNNQLQPWWQVDLGAITDISQIDIYNRTDCCLERLQNFYVFVSDQPFDSDSVEQLRQSPAVKQFHVAGAANRVTSVYEIGTGRHVRVQLADTGILSLAEVQVWDSGSGNLVAPGSFAHEIAEAVNVKLSRATLEPGVVFSATGLPPGLSMDNRTGVITGTARTAGRYTVQVSAEVDGEETDRISFEWAVSKINVNFQQSDFPVPAQHYADTGRVFAARNGHRFGWNSDHTGQTRTRGNDSDARLNSLVQFETDGRWEIALPSGSYLVTVGIGDGGFGSTHTINVEGNPYWSGFALAASQFVQKTHSVTVSDGRLTIDQGDAANKRTRINYITIDGVETCTLTDPDCDFDQDGIANAADAFPANASESIDSDADGVGDNSDAFPLNPEENEDSDGDGVGDNADRFPHDPAESLDSDNDGVGDNGDAFPDDPNRSEVQAVPGGVIEVDGDLSDWTGIPSFAVDPQDISGASNPLDWKQAWMAHDGNYLYIAYENYRAINPSWGQTIYLDTDTDSSSGFQNGMAIGADYVLQADYLYRYAGDGSNWQWEFVAQIASGYTATVSEMRIEQASLGSPANLRLVFVGGNEAYEGGTAEDLYPDGTYTSGAAPRYFEYSNQPPANSAPVVRDQLVPASPGVPVAFTLDASDTNNDALSYEVISDVSHGVITGTAPMLTFTADSAFSGTDWFTYRVSDGLLDSTAATVQFTVAAQNRYALSNLVSNLQLDGAISDWSAYTSFALDAKDVTDTASPIDWREAWIGHDETQLHIAYRFDSDSAASIPQWGINAFIDTDQDASTGYRAGAALGADYLLQGSVLYRHSGLDNNSWGWTVVSALPVATTGSSMELQLARQWLGNPDAFDIYFAGDNVSLGGTQMDYYPDGVYDVTAATSKFTYSLDGLSPLGDAPTIAAAEAQPVYSRQAYIDNPGPSENRAQTPAAVGSGAMGLWLAGIGLLLIRRRCASIVTCLPDQVVQAG